MSIYAEDSRNRLKGNTIVAEANVVLNGLMEMAKRATNAQVGHAAICDCWCLKPCSMWPVQVTEGAMKPYEMPLTKIVEGGGNKGGDAFPVETFKEAKDSRGTTLGQVKVDYIQELTQRRKEMGSTAFDAEMDRILKIQFTIHWMTKDEATNKPFTEAKLLCGEPLLIQHSLALEKVTPVRQMVSKAERTATCDVCLEKAKEIKDSDLH